MGDCVSRSIVKSAVRVLAAPIENDASFAAIVEGVITNNPWGCTSYQYGGATVAGVEKTRESYTARIPYQNLEAEVVGTVTARAPTVAAYGANVTAVMESADIASAMDGTAVHALEDDTFSAALECHDENGELYTVTFTRDRVTVGSYSDDTILTMIETWADTVPALA